MKIIKVDNFDREYIADTLICENVSEYYGHIIVDRLNEDANRPADRWFKMVDDSHVLWRGMEELV